MPEATALNCPSCGGSVALTNRFVKMVVCGYCGSTLAVENDRLDPTGKTAALVDYPTRFSVGRTGRIRGESFRVLGRVRYEYDDGYWDEWYLEFGDGGIAWLEEEEGQYTLSRAEALTGPVPEFTAVQVGAVLNVNGRSFFVTERCRARIAGAEGQLFYRARPGQPALFLDGNLGGRTAALEYGPDSIEFYVGDPLPRSQVALDGEQG